MTIRSVPASTTLAAFRSLKHDSLREEVLDLIERAGERGLIGDEVRGHFAGRGFKDGSINTRFSELERAGAICRNGDTRAGASGRQQLVLRSAEFATKALGTPAKHKRTGFLAGLIYAAKIVAKHPDLASVRAEIKAELIKASKPGRRI